MTLLFPLSLLDRNLASRMDCSSLGPRMLTLNFIHWILQVTLACWIWGRWKYLSRIFHNLKIKVKIICWKIQRVNLATKNPDVISMHKYSMLWIQWVFIFKIRLHRFTSIFSFKRPRKAAFRSLPLSVEVLKTRKRHSTMGPNGPPVFTECRLQDVLICIK